MLETLMSEWAAVLMLLSLLAVVVSLALLRQKHGHLNALEEKALTLTDTLQNKDIKLSQLEGKVAYLEQDSNALKAQLLETQAQVEHFRQSYHQAESQSRGLAAELDAAKSKAADLAERLLETQQRGRDMEERNETINKELKDKATRLESASVKLEESHAQLQQAKSELAELKQQHQSIVEEYQTLNEKHAVLTTSLEEREAHFAQQLSLFGEQKKVLEKEFENLANKIFEEKGKTFTSTSVASIEHLLKPFREQITEFRTRVDGIQKENNESTGSLRKELEHLRKLNQDMTTDAKNLTEALKGDKKKVGSWGEVQLEKTLQLAGLVKGDHYEAQAHFKDEHGKNNYPDFVVNLPDEKHIVIDSKVSLIAYDEAISAATDDELELALGRHVQAIKNHIDGLAAKDYSNLIGMRSPSFVLMFMPIEPAYIEAMKQNRELFNYGYQKGVILVSHTTLMPILRTVANLWMIERSNAEAREISDRAGDVYNQVCMLAERLQKLGGTLLTASKQYNATVVALAGQQGLHGKVERFSKLSNKITRSMPAIEAIHADVELDRLEVVRAADSEAGEKDTLSESEQQEAETPVSDTLPDDAASSGEHVLESPEKDTL